MTGELGGLSFEGWGLVVGFGCWVWLLGLVIGLGLGVGIGDSERLRLRAGLKGSMLHVGESKR